MPFIPLTSEEERALLTTLGLQGTEDIFSAVPPTLRENAEIRFDFVPGLDLTRGLSEYELRRFFSGLSEKNFHVENRCFLGAGFYDNIIPAALESLVSRGEFLYPPSLQRPEVSQGTLQALFEFQTLMCRITGMPVTQAADSGTEALVEAIRIAVKPAKARLARPTVIMASSLSPETMAVTRTFLDPDELTFETIGWNKKGSLDLTTLAQVLANQPCAALVVGYPNFFGQMEALDEIRAALPREIALLVYCADPSALSLFETPALLGADLVAGDARQFGTPLSFGGASLGFLSVGRSWQDELPGLLTAEIRDSRERRVYVATRAEGEILDEKALTDSPLFLTPSLGALRAAIFLSAIGKHGFTRLGEVNYSLLDYLTRELEHLGVPRKFPGGLAYREAVFEVPNLEARFRKALANGLVPGLRLASRFPNVPDLASSLLISVGPKHRRADIDALVEVISNG